jgi:hypothetical protein
MLQTPVLFIIFNRPDLTQRVFNEIKNAKPNKLYVSADGPRSNVSSDIEKCATTRKIIEQVDWDCKVSLLMNDTNLGCGKAVSRAITWFFSQEEMGIILEDDCLPDPSFFSYCEQLLIKYKDNNEIMHIGGANFQKGIRRGESSYYFSSIAHVWGWASWRRAWNMYDFNLSDFKAFVSKNKIRRYHQNKKVISHWMSVFKQMVCHEIDTWDHQWTYSIWNNGGWSIIPQYNLISNIGFGKDATHTSNSSPFANMEVFTMDKLIHPKVIEQNKEADLFTFYDHQQQKEMLFNRYILRLKRFFK